MKKLTAGIFATILGLTAVDAFAASNVASTKYVQGAIDSLATVAKTGDYNDLANTPDIPSIAGLATTEYVDQAETDAIAAAATAAEKYIDATELEASQTAQDTSLKAWVGDQGYVTSGALEAEGFATTGYVDQAETDAIAAAATAAAQLYVPLTAVVDSYPDASLNQQGQ